MTKYTLMLGLTLFAFGCPGDKGETGGADDSTGGDDSADPCEGQEATFDVAHSSSGVTLTITCGSGGYEFGMAETDQASDDPWTGEDCFNGYTTGDGTVYDICHVADSTGVVLSGGTLGDLCDDCGVTIMQNVASSVTTYYVSSDATGDCWVWGHDVSYYGTLGCTEM